jgi:hypothetical protein
LLRRSNNTFHFCGFGPGCSCQQYKSVQCCNVNATIVFVRCKMTNKCVKELVDLLMYFRFTPLCFGKWLPSSGGRKCLSICCRTTKYVVQLLTIVSIMYCACTCVRVCLCLYSSLALHAKRISAAPYCILIGGLPVCTRLFARYARDVTIFGGKNILLLVDRASRIIFV